MTYGLNSLLADQLSLQVRNYQLNCMCVRVWVLLYVHFRIFLVLVSLFLILVQTSSNTTLDTSSKRLIIVNLCFKSNSFGQQSGHASSMQYLSLCLSHNLDIDHIHTHFYLAIANGNVQILHNTHHHRARNAFALESYWWATLRNYFWQKIMRNTADALLHGFVFVSACLYIFCKNSFVSSIIHMKESPRQVLTKHRQIRSTARAMCENAWSK